MSAHIHDVAVALLGFLTATAVASSLPVLSLAAALRSQTIAYRAARAATASA
jgi:hypothetical protein